MRVLFRLGTLMLAGTLSIPSAAGAQDAPLPTAPPPPFYSPPEYSALGGVGESCRARADCAPGLRCFDEVCREEPEEPPPDAAETAEWRAFDEGVHAFAGLVAMGGPVFGMVTGSGAMDDRLPRSSFLFAVRGGVLLGRHELALEISPMTFFYHEPIPGPAFEAVASYAYALPLYASGMVRVSWPLRVGAGLMTGNTGDEAFFEARADLLGVAFGIGGLVIEVHAPSFRYLVSPTLIDVGGPIGGPPGTAMRYTHFMYWLFGVTASYAF